jgi:hypothetical protein
MNVEIETQTAQFPEKEYRNGIFAGYALSPSYIHMSTKKGLTQYECCRIKNWFYCLAGNLKKKMAEPEPITAFEGFSCTIKSFSALAW